MIEDRTEIETEDATTANLDRLVCKPVYHKRNGV